MLARESNNNEYTMNIRESAFWSNKPQTTITTTNNEFIKRIF